MPIFDTSPFSSLYGSFVDGYITGSALAEKTMAGTVVTNPNRGPVISVVSSALDVDGNLQVINTNGYTSFTEYRTAITQSKTLINRNIRYQQAVSQTEFYYDSFVPDINTIFEVDGGKLVLFNVRQGSAYPIFAFEYLFGTNIYSASLGRFIQHSLSSSTGTQVSNDKWLKSFPYEIKYRAATRLKGRLFNLSNLNYQVSGTVYNNSDHIIFNESPLKTRQVTSLPPAGISGFWQNAAPSYGFGDSAGIVFGFMFPTGALATYPEDDGGYSSEFSTFKGIIADKNTFASSSVDFRGTAPVLALTASTDRTNIKFVYGFGDGFYGMGEFITPTVNIVNTTAMTSVFFGSLIRGWKYGLKSGFPEASKVLVHRTRYGGLTSILGSRQYSAMYNEKTNTLSYPIRTEFISGSTARTYNLTSSLNTRDSGIYDTYYRSGRPFME
jgi:hypothetical protein